MFLEHATYRSCIKCLESMFQTALRVVSVRATLGTSSHSCEDMPLLQLSRQLTAPEFLCIHIATLIEEVFAK